jgi:hypothetical protein
MLTAALITVIKPGNNPGAIMGGLKKLKKLKVNSCSEIPCCRQKE